MFQWSREVVWLQNMSWWLRCHVDGFELKRLPSAFPFPLWRIYWLQRIVSMAMGLVGVTSRILNENQYKFMFRSPRNFFWPECSMIRERLNADHGPIHVPTSSLIIRRCPAMDDSPTKSTGKFRCHVCYMTNAINTFCCRRFDFLCMQISYDGRQSCKTHTRIQISCLLHD